MSIEAMGAIGNVGASSLLPQGGAIGGIAGGASGGADRFAAAIARAGDTAGGVGGVGGVGASSLSPTLDGFARMLDRVDLQAQSVSEYAVKAEQSGGTLTPGEIVNLTMRCQEFTFQCQLTSNIANRSSDGVTQLFRQQG